jgi:hypothetical protein
VRLRNTKKEYNKVLVFDLDETLGSFSELQWIWSALVAVQGPGSGAGGTPGDANKRKDENSPKEILRILLEIYSEFLRPGIVQILQYVANRKLKGDCMAVFLYTNNQHPAPWVDLLVEYFNEVVRECTGIEQIFDQTIRPFKIGGDIVEWLRTGHDKSYEDFIACTRLDPNYTEACFVDNSDFVAMKHPKVYYIRPCSYHHKLTPHDIIERFVLAETSGILDDFLVGVLSASPASSASRPMSFRVLMQSISDKMRQGGKPQPRNEVRQFITKNMRDFVAARCGSAATASEDAWKKNMHSLALVGHGGGYRHSSSSRRSVAEPVQYSMQDNPDKYFENRDMDIYISEKIMYFIREFFFMTSYSSRKTRKERRPPRPRDFIVGSESGLLVVPARYPHGNCAVSLL